ncbi:MAG TPA: HAD hydrolase family protein [Candidatus Obscuribacterales bacterium]
MNEGAGVIERDRSADGAADLADLTDLTDRIRRIKLVAFDFDGVFTDNTVLVMEDGTEAVRCWRSDGIGLRKLEAIGVASIIISTEPNGVVQKRAEKLRIRCLHGVDDKLRALKEIAAEFRIELDQIAFVGNDVNDLACLEAVGLPIVVADAHEDVLPLALLRTTKRGGYGAVREVCDLFARAFAS